MNLNEIVGLSLPMNNTLTHQLRTCAIEIGDLLLRKAIARDGRVYWPVEPRRDANGHAWRNSDSLYNGNTGIDVFLLNLYLYTQDEKYLDAVEKNLRWQHRNCAEVSTNNYSFYHGRMGLAYLCLLLYRHTSRASHLRKAEQIALACTKSGYLHSAGLRSSVSDGLAGTLQVFIALYGITGEKWVLDYIERAVEKLLEQLNLSPEGAFWEPVRENIRSFHGYAYGLSGIAVVLLQLGRFAGNASFTELARFALLQEDQLLKNLPGRAPEDRELSLIPGLAGIALGRLYADALTGKEEHRHLYAPAALAAHNGLQARAAWPAGNSLGEGRAGIGFFFLQLFRATKEEAYLEYAAAAAGQVANDLVHQQGQEAPLDFMHGLSGIGFFVLQVLQPSLDLGILGPDPVERGRPAPRIQPDSVLKKSPALLKEQIYRKDFACSMARLKDRSGEAYAQLFGTAYAGLGGKLLAQAESSLPGEEGEPDGAERLSQCRKEAAKFRLKKPIYQMDAVLAGEKQHEHFVLRVFAEASFSVSSLHDKVWTLRNHLHVIRKEENRADLNARYDVPGFIHFWTTYGRNTSILVLEGKGRVEEYKLYRFNLIPEQFVGGQRIDYAIGNLLRFFMSQPEEVRALLRTFTNSKDDDQLRAILQESITDTIYECIMDGFLTCEETALLPVPGRVTENAGA
ncbi:MAG: hypothetical protein AVDCRST_MAG56-6248 [uncultured Cytophagales bacterium]|uniref:Lanthionine biosynthesis protein LanM n=1 Tax=uncultured Cytophagales bacterium TaxID=158755 RepID=A0A6J4KP45_9SPHI|nr:MAG: hypothetical protein AVDCRST_MAG56-6248 [uncultured Cytophagales bacterium]